MFATPSAVHLLLRVRSTRRMAVNRFSSESTAKSPAVTVHGAGEGNKPLRDPNLNPLVGRLRQLMSSGPTDGWEKCWEEGVTPWDLGQATPIITHLVETGKLPEGRILVPGCGTGYDVVAMASPVRFVVGLDMSSTAINRAKEDGVSIIIAARRGNVARAIGTDGIGAEGIVCQVPQFKWSSSLPNAEYFTFLAEDFFTWTPTELFDVIFDYTFFCAIHPSMRSAWACKVSELLKPDGELITLMYLEVKLLFSCLCIIRINTWTFDDQEVGPPYNTSVADYVEVLNHVGFKAISIVDNELAVKQRKGAEKLGRWKKSLTQSSL